MRLWQFELKKLLYTQKGIIILAVCMLLKIVALIAVPEMKDERIKLTQKQYDKYLEQLYGANSPEKIDFITREYWKCKDIQNIQEKMELAYQAGELTEGEWQVYAEELNLSYLHENAAKIFLEKGEQFTAQNNILPPAHYIYEYGWQTVFSVQLFPDVFLLFGVLLLTAQCFCAETAGGMLPVLLAARNGRRQLFGAKLLALLMICVSATLLSNVIEMTVFYLRGFLNDGGVPIYSITLFAENCPLELTLWQGYFLCLLIRGYTTLLLAGMLYGISVWLKNSMNLIFMGACGLIVPLLLFSGTAVLLFTHIGLLAGSRTLKLWGESGLPILWPLGIVTCYSVGTVLLAMWRHQRGL